MPDQPNLKGSSRKPLITDLDFNRLISVIESLDYLDPNFFAEINEKLMNSEVVESFKAPPDLVTMNSTIHYRLTNSSNCIDEKSTLTLVYPKDADIDSNRISILSKVGISVLGCRVGEIVSCLGNDGSRREIFVEKVTYQPEISGDWHL